MRLTDDEVNVLSRIQEEVGAWSVRNFPKNTPYEPLLGMGEELGEIKHAVLKQKQGIRGVTPAEAAAAVADGLSDLLIFALDYASRRKYTMRHPRILSELKRDTEPVATFGVLAQVLGDLEAFYDGYVTDSGPCSFTDTAEATYLGEVVLSAFRCMRARGLDPIPTLQTTWDVVKQRDWVADAVAGGVHATP